MEKKTQKLLNGFLFSGIAFFIVLSLAFIGKVIWPVIWDEWNEYKKGGSFTSAKGESMKLYKNDYYNQAMVDSLEALGEKAMFAAKKNNKYWSPNGDFDFYKDSLKRSCKMQWLNLKDSIVYAQYSGTFHPQLSPALEEISIADAQNFAFPKDIIKDSIQLIIIENDKIVTRFQPIMLYNELQMGRGFQDRKNNEIKLQSENNKIMLYVKFKISEYDGG